MYWYNYVVTYTINDNFSILDLFHFWYFHKTRHSLEFIGGNFCQFLFVLVFSTPPTPHQPTPPPTPHPPTPPTPHPPTPPPPTHLPPPPPTHPPLRFTREQTRVEYIRRCRLMMYRL